MFKLQSHDMYNINIIWPNITSNYESAKFFSFHYKDF